MNCFRETVVLDVPDFLGKQFVFMKTVKIRIFFTEIISFNTEAKRRFATHDEDIDYFNMRIYYFNRMRIYSTV